MARLEFLRSALGSAVGVAGGKLGSDVTVVGTQSSILPPYDEEPTKPVAASLRKLGVQVLLDSKVQCLNAAGDAVRVQDAAGRESELAADQVLVAIGRVPHTHGWGLEKLMLAMNGRAIKVYDQCRTSMRNVWAIGDLTGKPMQAHRAMAQREMVAEIISGKRRHFNGLAFQPHEAKYRPLKEPSPHVETPAAPAVRPCLADPPPKRAVHKRD